LQDAELRLLASGGDWRAGRAQSAGRGAGGGAAVDGDIPDYALAVQRQINPGRDKIFGEGYVQVLGIAGVPERS
jgi:hypothetical protein